MEDPEQAFVEYASSRTNEMGSRPFTRNQGPRNFNKAVNAWKEKPNFNWAHVQTFTNPQQYSLSTYSSNYQTKLEKALGIKIPSKLLSPKYLSQSSIIEQNKNPSSPKRVHFVNSIVILNKENEAEEEGSVEPSKTKYTNCENANKTNEEVESEKEVEEEIEGEIEEEEEDDLEHFDTSTPFLL
ncbi:hypothetical protein Tco_1385764 [Tanacetum coccineum]